ncbi:DUF92 domain-containing protein [Metabacillus litoralis]|uniref:DUF92 domain-containing protein n=1 Tax=Metabacillus litoralis TaxID=152268 RepID=UPI0025596283|nr:DUF92 domain-containing protein [Metabacillus litoralis]
MFLSYRAWKMRSLSISGMIGAFVVGSAIFLGFSWKGLFLLGCFFVSSSLLSKVKAKQKSFLQEILPKGDQRDMMQVAANGGIPALIAVVYYFQGSNDTLYLLLFSISLAAANSDTWASEIGTLSKGRPRMFLTLKEVDRGTSGAVSLLGSFAGLVGAFFIGIMSGFVFSLSILDVLFVALFGFLGNIFDTVLGQTVQIKYKCKTCQKLTEKRIHCSKIGWKSKRYAFMNNDAVNFIAIVLTTILAFLSFI